MSQFPQFLRDRYGTDISHPHIRENDVVTCLLAHRSIRAYRPDPLPEGTLETLIAAAQSASSSSNLQTWSVVAVEDPDRKATLSTLAGNQPYIRQCPLFLAWLVDLARLTQIAEQRGLPHAGLDYLEMFLMAAIDAALASQNAAIAAESLGLGIVYIGGLRNRPEEVASVLQLPPHVFGVFGMCVGYPDEAQSVAIKPRLPQSAVLHRETYQAAQNEAIAHYNTIMRDFYAAQQMNVAGDWAEHSVKRVAGAESLSGRDRLCEILNRLGFPLL
ncbi:NADPH-dependent oxidoreductase [Oscillatoria sp. FACHB-1407]|uniref:NADPH-dependent oxidoreductase n=1 Tax=Oscillatoria sp. FACHB-1407 TaxID=2692847 RepID=UPI001689BB15|nr:NADPH-dependent oxidoreductase [Oscillatoria sp. FACHB-1407]MBD2461228.1 NADPH-dependent oxidoreductase [Oscillatoria sp. FACHB-1407]